MEFVIITGMSGAGRTQTTKFMEDLGYFCIDNIAVSARVESSITHTNLFFFP
jgi:RNase adaptor protein for sRNA GlmZ degradation